jgi:hypothetical protein
LILEVSLRAAIIISGFYWKFQVLSRYSYFLLKQDINNHQPPISFHYDYCCIQRHCPATLIDDRMPSFFSLVFFAHAPLYPSKNTARRRPRKITAEKSWECVCPTEDLLTSQDSNLCQAELYMHVELITRLFGGMALADRSALMNPAHADISVCHVLYLVEEVFPPTEIDKTLLINLFSACVKSAEGVQLYPGCTQLRSCLNCLVNIHTICMYVYLLICVMLKLSPSTLSYDIKRRICHSTAISTDKYRQQPNIRLVFPA